MHTGRFERTAPATFFLAACVGFFGACAAAIPAPTRRAQIVPCLRRRHCWIGSRQCHHRSSIHRVRTRCRKRARPPFRRQVRGRYLGQARAPGLIELSDEYGWGLAVRTYSSLEQVLCDRATVISMRPAGGACAKTRSAQTNSQAGQNR
jgi:hypothetical protein